MKCINKKLILLILIMVGIGSLLNGCGNSQISLPYEVESKNSSFNIKNNEDMVGNSFASNLCISMTDVFDNTDVNMEQATVAGLFDLNKQDVLYAKNIHKSMNPASLTKIMTAIVAMKYGNVDDVITVSKNVEITEPGAQLCGLKEGDSLTLNQALHALLIHSANDAGVAIAEHISGSVEEFSSLMNEEAVSLGATKSNFVNPHGLTDDNHYTTAYDLYLIFNEAIKYQLFNEIISMSSYDTVYSDKNGNNKEFSFHNTNLFIKGDKQAPDQVTVIGGKTGTTAAARNCLILLCKDASGNAYIAIILSSEERIILYDQMTDLLEEIYN